MSIIAGAGVGSGAGAKKAEALSVDDVKDWSADAARVVVDAVDSAADGVENGVVWVGEKVIPKAVKDAFRSGGTFVVEQAGKTYRLVVPQSVRKFLDGGTVWVKDQTDKVYRLVVPAEIRRQLQHVSTWLEEHPMTFTAVTIALTFAAPYASVLTAPRWSVVSGASKAYKTSTGVDFHVVSILPRFRDYCHHAKCGVWVPPEARDPKRILSYAEKQKVLNAVCDTEVCTVNGRTFDRKDAAIDHVIPHSCGGATTLKNSAVLHKDDNTAKAGCRRSL